MSKITITIVSDVSCPWCYVGRQRMMNAVKQITDREITYEYHPYIIDRGTKKDGEEYLAYNVRRWGGDGWTRSMISSSKADGCNFAGWKFWPYSLHCHRLMMYANTVGKGSDLMGIFFQMNYEEGKNLSVKKGLMEACERCGLDLAECEKIVDSNMYENEVNSELRRWHQAGVSGVPHYFIQFESGKVVQMSGAQSTEKWLKVLRGN